MRAEVGEAYATLAASLRDEPVAGDEAMRARVCASVRSTARLDAPARADIYREGYLVRHIDALAADFPALSSLLGDEGFEALARAFLAACPPRSPLLHGLGDELPSFIERAPGVDRHRLLLVELARLERGLSRALAAAEGDRVELSSLAGHGGDDFERARVDLAPDVSLLHLCIPVHEIIEPLCDGAPVDAPSPRVASLVLWREGDEALCVEVSATEARALEALAGGATIGEAFDQATAGLDEAGVAAIEGEVGGWFTGWVQRRWLARVRF